jgi:negative regulator of flagellin synthesis FlgM
MKIENDKQIVLLNNLAKTSSTTGGKDTAGAGSQTVSESGDKVELSGWKGEVASLTQQAAALPDVDEAKVARVKQAIESGTYNASGKMVARAMMKSNLLDETL